ncbi:MAG TPA: FADH2-dependent halogenase PltA [Chloroflexi bacterium]|nr:FADH2-dependent halogenase PltA [Chloroflexota bacterium]
MSDVIIIGGGPAGAAMGSYLSMAGISNTIFEGSLFPREHVGESLVTSTTRVLGDINFLETMEREGFTHKYGASWHPPTGNEFSVVFKEFPQEGIHQDYTYHVERSKFDHLLLQHAEKLGSKVYQGVPVKQVLFEGEQAVGVRVNLDGQDTDFPCKVVVDASGRGTLLGRQLNLKKKDPIFDQYAIHAWFEDVDRGTGPSHEYIHIYFLPVERGWVWQIPINDRVTSIGVVIEKEVFKQSKADLSEFFNKHTMMNPDLARAIKNARRINEFKREGDYSYSMDKFVGDGYVIIGDAARFVDPIFSSGISIALYSAKFASEHIIKALETGDFSAVAFEPYETRLRGGVQVWYEFIRLYYKLLPLFTHFIQSKTHREQVHRLLQGEVFDREEVPVLQAMRDYIQKVEETDSHIFKQHLSSIPLD